jgi:chromosome partitioning protein
MRSLAFVTQKGGSGKSTLASSVAVVAKEQGERACLVDLDPQATLMQWAKARGADDVPVVASSATKLPALMEALERKGFTLAILDTPGAEGAASLAAMKAAELCIIPSRPSMFDLWASAYTRATLKGAGGEYVFLLNQCPPAQQSARVEEGVKALEELGGLLAPLVQSRVDYQEAGRRGLGVTEVNASSPAAEEMRALWTSLRRRLVKLKAKGAVKKAA